MPSSWHDWNKLVYIYIHQYIHSLGPQPITVQRMIPIYPLTGSATNHCPENDTNISTHWVGNQSLFREWPQYIHSLGQQPITVQRMIPIYPLTGSATITVQKMTLIYPLTGPATNLCPENGLSHLQIMECPNVHIISLQLITNWFYATGCWIKATDLYERISTISWCLGEPIIV